MRLLLVVMCLFSSVCYGQFKFGAGQYHSVDDILMHTPLDHIKLWRSPNGMNNVSVFRLPPSVFQIALYLMGIPDMGQKAENVRDSLFGGAVIVRSYTAFEAD